MACFSQIWVPTLGATSEAMSVYWAHSMMKAMNEIQETIVLVLSFPLHIHAQYFSHWHFPLPS